MTLRELPRYLDALCITLWVGGMWLLGYVVVPVLFKALPDRQLAGIVAGQLFTLLAYIGIACALWLLAHELQRSGRAALAHARFRIIAAMLLLVLIGQYAIQPVMVGLKAQALPLDVMQSQLAGQFKAWHGVSAIVYLVQSLLAAALVVIDAKK